MRLIFTVFFFLLFCFTAGAQRLTGIWRGYFSSSNSLLRDDPREELYKYEIQIDQQANNAIKGVTYSYKTTVFYAKTGLQGIFTAQTKSLIIKETKILELKIGAGNAPCLMTCYLDYAKMGKLEVLQGTFISVGTKNQTDCGSGKIYLEKVPTSDFGKEDFLLKKSPPPARSAPPQQRKMAVPQEKKVIPKTKKPVPPVVKKDTRPMAPKPVDRVPDDAIIRNWKSDTLNAAHRKPGIIKSPVPRVLLERENRLVKTIYTDEEDIQIDIYDNGIIDNDTISLYHNNKLVVSNGRLSYTPITYHLKCNNDDPHHEFVIVAENLGEIPPNTALMVITVGRNKKRYEIFLASNESRNAKVIIEYRPGG